MRESQFLIWVRFSLMRNGPFLIRVWLSLMRNTQTLIWVCLPLIGKSRPASPDLGTDTELIRCLSPDSKRRSETQLEHARLVSEIVAERRLAETRIVFVLGIAAVVRVIE